MHVRRPRVWRLDEEDLTLPLAWIPLMMFLAYFGYDFSQLGFILAPLSLGFWMAGVLRRRASDVG